MLGIIGGTGIYAIDGLSVINEHLVDTPFGAPSAPVLHGRLGATEVMFLPRHGRQHELLPHEVNYRANIYALKALGVRQIIGLSAVGSLRQEIAPGDFTIPTQYVDWVRGNRAKTFFGDGLAAHVSSAEPTCSRLASTLEATIRDLRLPAHAKVTYGCVDGPRLGTRAESHFLRNAMACDVVGMTNVPEVFLAREAQICYCTLGIVTDYDCWLEDPAQHVTVAAVIARYGASVGRAKQILTQILSTGLPDHDACSCRHALCDAVLTPEGAVPAEKRALLQLLRA
ncbi:S-methyl-5'-thioadenosine phosphorylase [Cupriavidus sp. IK-TO18]|uniref:S-methyl-5'-thioadenosine phosphorylase n=1 Tax=unclassified Cupriavidus TaxID=2640874 RepID=UPI00189A4DC7|nr:S-methyl-5'-thioadenosine phosphorylase [Cupriavidus sp. IK-TO18]MBF6989464.1 S-methyl-5'-thioadenosine phosphorylase [Cupriavidus sp. IK-TO18]